MYLFFFFSPLYGFHEQHSHIRCGSLNTPHILHRACNTALKIICCDEAGDNSVTASHPLGRLRDPGFQQGTWQQELQLLSVPLCLLLSQTTPFCTAHSGGIQLCCSGTRNLSNSSCSLFEEGLEELTVQPAAFFAAPGLLESNAVRNKNIQSSTSKTEQMAAASEHLWALKSSRMHPEG